VAQALVGVVVQAEADDAVITGAQRPGKVFALHGAERAEERFPQVSPAPARAGVLTRRDTVRWLVQRVWSELGEHFVRNFSSSLGSLRHSSGHWILCGSATIAAYPRPGSPW
jgi:hypothetical protein